MEATMNVIEKYLHLVIAVAISIAFWYFTAPNINASLLEGSSDKVDLPPVSSVPPMTDLVLKRDPFRSKTSSIIVNPTGASQRKVELAGIYIDGVICSSTQRSVIIGGTVYNEGDKFKEATIMTVAPDKVLFLFKGALVEKRLNIPTMQVEEGEQP
jgi:hypothetical protein